MAPPTSPAQLFARFQVSQGYRSMAVRDSDSGTREALLDVARHLNLPEASLEVLGESPRPVIQALRQTQALKVGEPPEVLEPPLLRSRMGRHGVGDLYDTAFRRLAPQSPIDLRDARAVHGPLACLPTIHLQARAQGSGQQFPAAAPYSVLHVVPREPQLSSTVVHATHGDVDMRVIGVVVVDRGPLQPSSQVLFHLGDQGARMRTEIDLAAGLRGDHQLPEPAVSGLLPDVEAVGQVHVIPLTVESESPSSFTLGARSTEVVAVRSPAARLPGRIQADRDRAPEKAPQRELQTGDGSSASPSRAHRFPRSIVASGRAPPMTLSSGMGPKYRLSQLRFRFDPTTHSSPF